MKKFLEIVLIILILSCHMVFAAEIGDNYQVYTVGYGIKYDVTDTLDDFYGDVWAIVQCDSADSFMLTLTKEGVDGPYFSDSALTGVKNYDLEGKKLIFFQSGCPVGNQANFYSMFNLPVSFQHGDNWEVNGTFYTVEILGSININGQQFDDCIKISLDATASPAAYLQGSGYFIAAKGIGIIQLVFNRTGNGYEGTMVQYDFIESKVFSSFNVSGTVVDGSHGPLADVLIQLSNCNGCLSSLTDADGSFSLPVYGPDIVLKAGYDFDEDSVFDSLDTMESGYATKKVSGIDGNVNAGEIILPETYVPIKEWGGQGGGEGLFNQPTGIAVAGDGHIYVADTLNNRIQKFNPDGSFNMMWSKGYDDRSFLTPLGIAVDQQGNVYVADGNAGNVQQFTSEGIFVRKWTVPHSPCGVALSPDEDFLYVTEEAGDCVVKVEIGGEHTVTTFVGESGSGNGQLDHPSGIATDGSGNIYVVDINNSRVQKFTADGTYSSQIVLTDNFTPNPSWPLIYGLYVDHDDNLYVANVNNDSIDIYGNNGLFAGRVGCTRSPCWELNGPNGITFDTQGSLYVVSQDDHRFLKLNGGSLIMSVGGFGGDGDGFTNKPVDCEIYEDGTHTNLYVLEFWNCRVQKFDSQGGYLGQWGTLGSGEGEFRYPEALAVDPVHECLYVSDSGNHRVQKFDLDGNYVGQWGSFGTDDAQFQRNTGIAVDSAAGVVYVADCDNPRVQKFDLNGNFLRQWGSSGTGDGEFVSPRGIAVDKDGYVYVADESPGGDTPAPVRVQKFDANGNFLQSFTLPDSASGSTGAPRLYDLEFDNDNNLFVCCSRDVNQVHKFSPALEHITAFGDLDLYANEYNGLAVDSAGFVYVCDAWTNKIYKYMKKAIPFRGTDYLASTTGLGIQYHMTDTYDGTDFNVWAVTQCDSQDDFLLTLTSDSCSGGCFSDSSLTGVKNYDLEGKKLIFFQSGCPVGNQANFYRMFNLPVSFQHSDNWEVNGTFYTVEIPESININGQQFDDCIKISLDATASPAAYLQGSGYFIAAKGIGIIQLVFNRTGSGYEDTTVQYQYLDDEAFVPHTLSGTVTDPDNNSLEGILVQLSNCDGCLYDISDQDGAFSVSAYGPDIVLRAGYDIDQDHNFDSYEEGYFKEIKVYSIIDDVDDISFSGFAIMANGNQELVDFNADDIHDIALFYPDNQKWYVKDQSTPTYGTTGCLPVPGDYDGDGTTDLAVVDLTRGDGRAKWYLDGVGVFIYGLQEWIPVPGDYDGDGTTDAALFDPATGKWYIRNQFVTTYGAGGIPVPGDYDGDGTTDIAVFYPAINKWYIRNVATYTYGMADCIPVPADYDGDGITDLAVIYTSRPDGMAKWYIRNQAVFIYGAVDNTIPVPGDYDGDGDADPCLFYQNTGKWYCRNAGIWSYGNGDMIPLASNLAIRYAMSVPGDGVW